MRQCRLAGAGRPHDQHFFPGIDGQIDILYRRFLLGTIFKRKIFKFNNRFHESLMLSVL